MKNKTTLLAIHRVIKSFADSMVKAFVPLIILKATENMYLVMLYLVCYSLLSGFLNFALKAFVQKFGVIAIILQTIPIIALQFILLLPMHWWVVLIAALLAALAQALYSVPLNILFSFTDKDVNVSKFEIPSCLGKLIFLILSGYVIGSSVQNSLLILSIVGTILYIASSIPLFYGYNLIKTSYAEITSKKPQIDKKSYVPYNFLHMGFGLYQGVVDVTAPIYLYANNLTFQAVAIVMAAIELCKVGANMFAWMLVKKNKKFLSYVISVCLLVVGSIVVLVVKIPIVLYICTVLMSLGFPLLLVPSFHSCCEKFKQEGNQFNGMSYRDVFIMSSKSLAYLPYFAIPNLIVPFVVGLSASVAMLFCCRKTTTEN